MWQNKGRTTNGIVSSKCQMVYEGDEHENEFFISYSFHLKEEEIKMERVQIHDIPFWHSIESDSLIEIVFIERSPRRCNLPKHVMANRCEEGSSILTSLWLSVLMMLSALTLSIGICHDRWNEAVLLLLLYPAITLILMALCCLCWNGNAKRKRLSVGAKHARSKLLPAKKGKEVMC